MLGPLQTLPGPGEAAPRLRPSERRLVSVLLLFHGQACPQDLLARGVWGEKMPRHPGTALRTSVARARKALGPAGARLISRAGAGYRASPPPGSLDLARFSALVAAAQDALAAARLEDAQALLGDAVAAWPAGEAGEPEDAAADADAAAPEIAASAARLAAERGWAALARADALIDLGRHEELLPALHAAVVADPHSEQAWEQFVLALDRAGRPDEAVAAYTRAREAVIHDLGVLPAAGLRAIVAAVMAGAAGGIRLTARYAGGGGPG